MVFFLFNKFLFLMVAMSKALSHKYIPNMQNVNLSFMLSIFFFCLFFALNDEQLKFLINLNKFLKRHALKKKNEKSLGNNGKTKVFGDFH